MEYIFLIIQKDYFHLFPFMLIFYTYVKFYYVYEPYFH